MSINYLDKLIFYIMYSGYFNWFRIFKLFTLFNFKIERNLVGIIKKIIKI